MTSVFVCCTYIIDQNHNLPIISIATEPDFLFDSEVGIYVKGTNGTILHGDWVAEMISLINLYGMKMNCGGKFFQDWERPISIEFFDKHGSQIFKSQAGIKIHGGGLAPSSKILVSSP